jgi:hypothetical protein
MEKEPLAEKEVHSTNRVTHAIISGMQESIDATAKLATASIKYGAVIVFGILAVFGSIFMPESGIDYFFRMMSEEQSYNAFLLMRSFCLGALGALAIIVHQHAQNRLQDDFDQIRGVYSMLSGGVVAVIAFGLFHTRQISIFHSSVNAGEASRPEYWRVTVLCLLSGAFSDKLVRVATNKVDDYLERGGKIRNRRPRSSGVSVNRKKGA